MSSSKQIFLASVTAFIGFLLGIYWSDNKLGGFDMKLKNKQQFIRHRVQGAIKEWEKAKVLRESVKPLVITQFNKTPWARKNIYTLWDFFYANFNCPYLVTRVGSTGDGGKWVCGFAHLKKKKTDCIVYSFGVGSETSFEKEILDNTKCKIYMYDPTIAADSVTLVKKYDGRVFFYKTGLGSNVTTDYTTLKTEMEKHGHEFIDILKVDVEGAEFEAFIQMGKEFPRGFPFAQLQIELHMYEFKPMGLFTKFDKWWQILENGGLRPFRNEVNFLGGTVLASFAKCVRNRITNVFTMDQHMEFSFLNVEVDNYFLH